MRDADALATAMDGVDAVISTLGIGSARAADNLIVDSTRAIVTAADLPGRRRRVPAGRRHQRNLGTPHRRPDGRPIALTSRKRQTAARSAGAIP
ncbi:hypothetical protein [Promicromonospora soli]